MGNLIPMQRLETSLPGVCELRPQILRDARGFFMETYHRDRFATLGIGDSFVQDKPLAVIEGHPARPALPATPPAGEALPCRRGRSLRCRGRYSRWLASFRKMEQRFAFGKGAGIQIYIPAGFAHGYLALTDTVQFLYKCSDYYAPSDEHGILWNDPMLAINWGNLTPALSQRDANNPKLADVQRQFLPRYSSQ